MDRVPTAGQSKAGGRCHVIRIMLPICMKAALDGTLERDAASERNREAALEELDRQLGAAADRRRAT